METFTKSTGNALGSVRSDFIENVWEKGWTYIKTVVDITRDSLVILDKDLRVMTANKVFYRTFRVEPKDTENVAIEALGSGQWNNPPLRKLLEDILPNNTFFRGFEVAYEFPFIGRKIMMLNARQMYWKEGTVLESFPPCILLAIENVTEVMIVAETLAGHANQLKTKLAQQSQRSEIHNAKLGKEMNKVKKNQQDA